MARPRKTSGKSTSFGKRSDAEKSFHNRKKERPSYGDEKPRRSSSAGFGGRSAGSKPSRFSKPGGDRKRSDDSSSDRPKRFSKPFEKREGSEGRPFRKSAGSFGDKPRFSKPFEKREDGEGRPFRKAPGSFDSERPKRFSKPFDKSEGGERPFRKSSSSFGDKPRFSKPFDKKEGGESRPFRKSSGSFDADKPKRFSKPFEKRDDDRSFKKPGGDFGTRPRKSFEEGEEGGEKRPRSSANFGKPYVKKPFVKREERKDIPFRKNARFGQRAEEEVPKFNRNEDVVKKGGKAKAAPAKAEGDADLIRLNKFMANSGVGSRRQADEFIKLGLVTVNGEVVTEMGHKIKLTDEVRYEGKRLKSEKLTYVLLNKPKGFITTTDDPQDRNTVMGLVASAGKERIYPVGRLDRNTTGLLLLTNDGDLADKLTHPSYNVKKIYKVELDKPLTKNDFQKIVDGVYLEEGRAMVDDLAIVSDDSKEVGIELHIGWNRIVRRIFESLGYEVVKLDRVVYAGLDKKDLSRGQWRFLKPEEIIKLKHFK